MNQLSHAISSISCLILCRLQKMSTIFPRTNTRLLWWGVHFTSLCSWPFVIVNLCRKKKKGNAGPKLTRHPVLRRLFVEQRHRQAITNIWCVLVKSVCSNLLHRMCETRTLLIVWRHCLFLIYARRKRVWFYLWFYLQTLKNPATLDFYGFWWNVSTFGSATIEVLFSRAMFQEQVLLC